MSEFAFRTICPSIDSDELNVQTQIPVGTIIFNTTTQKFQGYNGTLWIDLH